MNSTKDENMEKQEEKVTKQEEVNNHEEQSETPASEKTTEESKELSPEEKLQQSLDEAEKRIAEIQDKYLRLSAEFDNYRKRTIKEKSEIIKNAAEKTITAILPVLDDMERGAEKLLHAKSGAALARYVFGQSETVFRAILYHTTGRGNMTLPEKLLYLADYMEPTRDFPEVGQLRRLAYEDLDRAVLMGAELSIREMMERNRVVHPNTLEAEQTLRKGLGL